MRHARSAALAAFALVVVALVALARPPAPAAVAVASPYATLDLASGPTFLKAPGTLHLNLAANFFGPGSPAFNGNVDCTGTVLKTAGAYELGSTTLVLERQNNAEIDYPMTGGPVPVCAKVVEFGLTGSAPIQFTVSGQAQSWNVTAMLSDTRAPAVQHTLSRTADTSGTFSGSIKIPVLVKFTRGAVVKTLDLGVVELTGSSVTWTTIATSNTAGLAVPQLNLGVALTGTFSSSDLDLNIVPGAVNPNRPGATSIDPSATVSASVATIGRQCIIGANAVIDAGVVIGRNANIGANVHVYPNAVIGDYASIASGTTVGAGVQIGSNSTIGSNCAIADGAGIGNDVTVSDGTTVGENSIVRCNSTIAANCTIGDDCDIGQSVSMGAASTVNDDLAIYEGASIAASHVQTKSIVWIKYTGGSTDLVEWPPGLGPTWLATFTIDTVTDYGDPAENCVAGDGGNLKKKPQNGPGHFTQDEKFLDLPGDIGTGYCEKEFGGPHVYDAKKYDCNSFAETLRAHLASLQYTTTFTVVRILNPQHRWCDGHNCPKWMYSHSMVDIHWLPLNGGTITWVDAQLPNGDGVDGQWHGHDFDDDGQVQYADGVHVNEPTDGDLCIEVFSSREAAEAAYGHKFEG